MMFRPIGDLLRKPTMKIVAIDTYPLVLPIKEIYGGAAGFLEDCRSLIVRVETENGIEGWGEATQGRPGNTYETLETMEIMAQKYFAPALIGMDLGRNRAGRQQTSRSSLRPSDHQSRHRNSALRRCWEKLYRLPLCRFFGGPYRREMNLVGGLGMDLGPEAIGARARSAQARGFPNFQDKNRPARSSERYRTGARGSPKRSVTTRLIRVDGNAAYSFVDARNVLNELSQFHITDAEQPLARGDLRSLAELRRAVGISDRRAGKRQLAGRCAGGA